MTDITHEASVNHASDNHGLQFVVQQSYPTLCQISVFIPKNLVDACYHEATLSQRTITEAHGFEKGNVPLKYIQENYKSNLDEHVKEFLFHYFVTDFLYSQIYEKKLLVAGEPRLQEIHCESGKEAQFDFELSLCAPVAMQEWKYLPFKAPKRKNYKDLDRQVEAFINDEQENEKKNKTTSLEVGDWVNFTVALVDNNHQPIFGSHRANVWLKLGDEEADAPLTDVFLGKAISDSFYASEPSIQNFFTSHLETSYLFLIEIQDILKSTYFCFDSFKKHFKLKTNKELYQKLIEVFSYRNDLSQRRSMAGEALALLLSKHRFVVPSSLVLRQQKEILDFLQTNPDYHVYRTQKDFKERVHQLAEKQACEMILLDQLAYHENIMVTNQDVKYYLNLINRPRTKEFIYFDPTITKVFGQEIPLASEELKRICLREKTLNHIIYHLTKK